MRTALTIAGSDSGGGAGIQADLKTFGCHAVYGVCAITAITAQNTLGVTAIHTLPVAMVTAQIDAVVTDFRPSATKIGMLANSDIVHAVAESIRRYGLKNVVLDPVMIAKSRASLLDAAAVESLKTLLIPHATVLTPNLPEAEALTGLTINSVGAMRRAAKELRELGPAAVVIKGGHLDGPAVDVLSVGEETVELSERRIDTHHTHGTGCTFSAAIAARLALGADITTAVRIAKDYVRRAIAQAPRLGAGHGPLEHFPSK